MQEILFEKIKNIPKFWWIFLAIVIIGIFLRTWHHHDWLRFNADQGRDTQIVSDVVDGKTSLPLLGPKAGGTEFRLGPAFYWFEIAAAKIFGNAPDKMAYPDLLTGILCIPLLFFFLRKYFGKNQSLALTTVFAVSAYAIRYARFAWNPNSSPFWAILFLYALCEIVSEKENRKFWWSALAGAAIGIGVQLHTTLLAILPATAVVVFGYFSFKNKKFLKYFFVVVVAALLLNVPQLISEHQTGWKNMSYFSRGLKVKNKSESSISKNAVQSASCWIQGNLDIVSGYEISDACEFKASRSAGETAVFFLGLIFAAGGTILGLKYLFKENDVNKKYFLGIVFVFTGITYLIFLKFAFELSVRFYLPLVFLPFVLLGFWAKFISEKFKVRQDMILLAAAALLIFSNLFFVQKYFAKLANYGNVGGGDVNVMILGEAEVFSQFIIENSSGSQEAYLDGNGQFLFKGFKSIRYLVRKANIDLVLANKNSDIPERYFYIASLKKKEKM
ncbi:MAG: glycosyltransferase family 39 protein, partial [Candidatus Moraniibacteriota bacterium]